MKILAVDPGFERMGLAIIEKTSGKEKLLFSCCVKTPPSLPFSKRLRALGDAIQSTIRTHTPSDFAIETLLFNTNQKTALRVSEARGVILYEAERAGLLIYEYTPLQVKIAITGYGRASKEQVELLVKKLIGVSPDKRALDDEIDAIAIGLTHLATNQITRNL